MDVDEEPVEDAGESDADDENDSEEVKALKVCLCFQRLSFDQRLI